MTVQVPFQRSIRFRLSLIIAGVIFCAVMAASAAGAFRDLRQSADARAEMLAAAASAYSAAVSEPLSAGDRVGALEHMKGMREVHSVIFMALKDSEGAIFVQLGGGASVRGRTPDLRAIEGLDLLSADRGTITMPVIKAGEQIGSLVILADISDLRRDLMATLAWTALVALIAIAAGVAVAQITIARLTRPIRDLASAMADVGARQDFSRRVDLGKRRDETAVLGDAFNGMIDNIRKRDEQIAHHVETLEQTVEDRTRDYRLAKEDAEAANAAKSDFLATMSHEIRTPMNGMMVMAEMLASADLTARHRRYAEIITRSGASLLTIINDILDLSKIEAGKLDLEAVPFSPEALVEDVASLFWEKARSKNLELAVRIAPEVPALVIGDPTRVNQIVTNLVNNALKFTETGGVTIDLSAQGSGDRARLRIAVTDTGVGIEKNRIGAIFEAFSQADQSTTRRFGGTGLGLTVCKRLVEAMGGEIVVDSEIGKGSTFAVHASFAVEKAAPATPDMASLRFALALPAPLLSRSVAHAFRDLGCEPRLIPGPRQAQAGELVLTTSDLLARQGAAPGATHICLTDVGDNRADQLIRDRIALDLLPLPLGRQALWDFIARAARNEYRGAAALAGAASVSPAENFGHLGILAVDDNAVNREVLREALLSLGVEADFVANGQEAVDAAKARAYDIIFMDGSMPVMDGFTATRLIREHEAAAGRRAFIVALTAQVRGADADAWAQAGADRHMTKPFTSARLTEALKTVGPGSTSKPATRSAAHPDESREPGTVLQSAPVPGSSQNPEHASLLALGPGVRRDERKEIEARAESETPLIDDEAVSAMEQVGARSGRDVVGKVWKLFLGQAPDAVFKLEMLASQENADQLAKQAHFLKSMSLSAGAAQVAAICEAIEHDGKAADLGAAGARVPELRPVLEATCALMREQLEARSKAATG
ncbi:MAG TPA: ATP-binding protein [Hyphomonadaceae bacterium]|nr:ATP-binding protein [Hyphomonadaceae bacterium]